MFTMIEVANYKGVRHIFGPEFLLITPCAEKVPTIVRTPKIPEGNFQ